MWDNQKEISKAGLVVKLSTGDSECENMAYIDASVRNNPKLPVDTEPLIHMVMLRSERRLSLINNLWCGVKRGSPLLVLIHTCRWLNMRSVIAVVWSTWGNSFNPDTGSVHRLFVCLRHWGLQPLETCPKARKKRRENISITSHRTNLTKYTVCGVFLMHHSHWYILRFLSHSVSRHAMSSICH